MLNQASNQEIANWVPTEIPFPTKQTDKQGES